MRISQFVYLAVCAMTLGNLGAAHADVLSEAGGFIKTLNRPLDVYTWEPRATFKSAPGEKVDPRDPRIKKFLVDYANDFYSPTATLGYVGPNGIYAATDPFISREWGSGQSITNPAQREWSVNRITLPAGAKFFDGRMTNSFPAALQGFIRQRGCASTNMRDLISVRPKSLEQKRACWKAYTELARLTNIQAVAQYFYAFGPQGICREHNVGGIDFIIVDANVITDNNFAGFVAEIPDNDPVAEERVFIRDYWRVAKQETAQRCGRGGNWGGRFSTGPGENEACIFAANSASQFGMPWELPNVPFDQGKFTSTLSAKIFGCGPSFTK